MWRSSKRCGVVHYSYLEHLHYGISNTETVNGSRTLRHIPRTEDAGIQRKRLLQAQVFRLTAGSAEEI